MEKIKLSRDEKIAVLTKKMFTKFGSLTLVDKSQCVFDGPTLEAGKSIYLTDGAGDWFLLADGNYLTANQQPFTVLDGKIKSVGTAQITNQNQPESQNQLFKKTTMSKETKSTEQTRALEIDAAYAQFQFRSGGNTTVSRADFGKQFEPTKQTDTELLFARAAKVRELNAAKPNAPITYSHDAVKAETWLTTEQRAEANRERVALGLPTFQKTEKHSEKHSDAHISKRKAEHAKYTKLFGEAFNCELEDYISFSDEKISQMKEMIDFAMQKGVLKMKKDVYSSTGGQKKTILEQALEAKGWQNYKD